jgi:hypothetical protein
MILINKKSIIPSILAFPLCFVHIITYLQVKNLLAYIFNQYRFQP